MFWDFKKKKYIQICSLTCMRRVVVPSILATGEVHRIFPLRGETAQSRRSKVCYVRCRLEEENNLVSLK